MSSGITVPRTSGIGDLRGLVGEGRASIDMATASVEPQLEYEARRARNQC
jgi:hypothetical protein